MDGYRFVWKERLEIFKFSFPVLFICVFFNLLAIYTGADDDILRRGLVTLPSTFVLGYFLCELVRYTLFNEPFVVWGYTRRSRIESFSDHYRTRKLDIVRRRSVSGGVVFFVLFWMFNDVFAGLGELINKSGYESKKSATLSLEALPGFILESGMILLIILGLFWFVRVGYIYVSFSAGYDLRSYFRRLQGLYSSVPLFLCSLLVGLLLVIPVAVVNGFISVLMQDAVVYRFVLMQVLEQVVIVTFFIINTAACSFGIREMMGGLPRSGALE